MDSDIILLAEKAAALLSSALILPIVRHIDRRSFEKKTSRRKDFEVTHKFLSKKLETAHNYSIEKWYFSLSGDQRIGANEIRLLLMFHSPTMAFMRYKNSRDILDFIPSADGKAGHLRFKKNESNKIIRRALSSGYFLLYFVFFFTAFGAGYLAIEAIEKQLYYILLPTPVWISASFFMAFSSLRNAGRSYNAEQLLEMQEISGIAR